MKVVLCHGVFDLLHRGHVAHLQEARAFGDRLIVSLVPDRFVQKKRPLVYDQDERMALLIAVRYVDEVVLCDGPGPETVIEKMRPDIYVRGPDYIGKDMPEGKILGDLGIPVGYTASSFRRTTDIIRRIQSDVVAA